MTAATYKILGADGKPIIRQLAPNRGALEFAWGNQMATARFVVH